MAPLGYSDHFIASSLQSQPYLISYATTLWPPILPARRADVSRCHPMRTLLMQPCGTPTRHLSTSSTPHPLPVDTLRLVTPHPCWARIWHLASGIWHLAIGIRCRCASTYLRICGCPHIVSLRRPRTSPIYLPSSFSSCISWLLGGKRHLHCWLPWIPTGLHLASVVA